MTRPLASICATLALFLALPVSADAGLDGVARDVDRTESLRAVKTLQSSYAQYAQYGLWNEVGALFARDGSFVFDGMIKPVQTAKGPGAIAAFLRTRYGGGHEGLKADSLSTLFIDAPVVNLSTGGNDAKARWQALIFHGHGREARIEGGVFENDYVREKASGRSRRRATSRSSTVSMKRAGPTGVAATCPSFPDISMSRRQVSRLRQRPVRHPRRRRHSLRFRRGSTCSMTRTASAISRRLTASTPTGRCGTTWSICSRRTASSRSQGRASGAGPREVRRWLESIGPAGLTHGQLNDRLQNDVTVTVSAGGNEAFARGIELGMLGEADQEKGWWGSRDVPQSLRQGRRRVEDPRDASRRAHEEPTSSRAGARAGLSTRRRPEPMRPTRQLPLRMRRRRDLRCRRSSACIRSPAKTSELSAARKWWRRKF